MFIPSKELLEVLSRYQPVNQMKSSSVKLYEQFKMVYCNPVPIAKSCAFSRQLVDDAIYAIVQAILDLSQAGFSLDIKFNFALL